MAMIFLIISAILFVATFGIHMFIISGDPNDKPMYTSDPIMSKIPWISGFVLSIIPWTILTHYNWLLLFFINLAAVYIIGPTITQGLLERFASGKSLGKDMFQAFIGGFIALIIGIIFK